jgi:hypothetical protein
MSDFVDIFVHDLTRNASLTSIRHHSFPLNYETVLVFWKTEGTNRQEPAGTKPAGTGGPPRLSL